MSKRIRISHSRMRLVFSYLSVEIMLAIVKQDLLISPVVSLCKSCHLLISLFVELDVELDSFVIFFVW